MRDIFRSPREAIAYMYAARRGPSIRGMPTDDAPREQHDKWTHVIISAIIYGPADADCCAIEYDSPEEAELIRWATERGAPRTSAVLRIERHMRRRLRELEMMPSQKAVDMIKQMCQVIGPDGIARLGFLKGKQ